MKTYLKILLKKKLKQFNIAITRYSNLKQLSLDASAKNSAVRDLFILQKLNSNNNKELFRIFDKSKSQLRQDLFVLSHLEYKKMDFL